MAVGKVVLVLHCRVGNQLAGLGLVNIFKVVLANFHLPEQNWADNATTQDKVNSSN